MAAPYSIDFRNKVVEAYNMGKGSFASIADRFMIGEATVNRWVTLVRKHGTVTPKPMGGARRKTEAAEGACEGGGEAGEGSAMEQVEAADGTLTLPQLEGSSSEVSELKKEAYIEGAKALKGSDRRLFMARVVKSLGEGGQSLAIRELGWGRASIRKGMVELQTGVRIEDNFSARGRKSAQEYLPQRLEHIRKIVDGQTQTDPTFQTTRLYTRLSARAVREALISQFAYTDEQLPHVNTIGEKLNALGYRVRPVRKTQPKKKLLKPTPFSTCSK